jgi:hypothetical protein
MAEKEEKKEKTGGNLMDAVIEQSINEFTRPLVKKISPATLQMLKKIGADKILPILSVGFQTFFKDKFGGKTSDVIAEVSAELRRAILEDSGETMVAVGDVKTATSRGGVEKKAFSVIFNSEISDKTVSLVNAWVELFKNDSAEERPEKEKKQILSLIGQMEPSELFVFLTQKKNIRGKVLNTFLAKAATEKPFEEAIKEFKEDVEKLMEKAKIIHQEIFVPIGAKVKPHIENLKSTLKEVDDQFSETGAIGKELVAMERWAKNFRETRRRR